MLFCSSRGFAISSIRPARKSMACQRSPLGIDSRLIAPCARQERRGRTPSPCRVTKPHNPSMRPEDEQMSGGPEIVTRAEQPDVAISAQVTMAGLGAFAARTGEVFAWLDSRGLASAGAQFLKCN